MLAGNFAFFGAERSIEGRKLEYWVPRLEQARCHRVRIPLAVTRRLELEGAGRRAEAARELCLRSVWKPALVESPGR